MYMVYMRVGAEQCTDERSTYLAAATITSSIRDYSKWNPGSSCHELPSLLGGSSA